MADNALDTAIDLLMDESDPMDEAIDKAEKCLREAAEQNKILVGLIWMIHRHLEKGEWPIAKKISGKVVDLYQQRGCHEIVLRTGCGTCGT